MKDPRLEGVKTPAEVTFVPDQDPNAGENPVKVLSPLYIHFENPVPAFAISAVTTFTIIVSEFTQPVAAIV
jgi:hypothetical protein